MGWSDVYPINDPRYTPGGDNKRGGSRTPRDEGADDAANAESQEQWKKGKWGAKGSDGWAEYIFGGANNEPPVP